jgi:hypothetical protein
MSPLRERNLKIVSMLDSGNYTLQDVANLFGISSRERARQIYVATANQPYAYKHGKKQKILKELKHLEKMKEIKYQCRGCGKLVTYGQSAQKSRYCSACSHISEVERRIPYIYLQCLGCSKKFHPYRNWQLTRAVSLFHSIDCYIKYRKTHGMLGYGNRTKALSVLTKSQNKSS